MTKLKIENLGLSYGSLRILHGISLDIEVGEIIVLLGPSGSGKTTLLRSIAGLESPDQGRIELDGKSIFDAKANVEKTAEDRNLGFVFQSYALWPHKTVSDNVAYGLKLRNVARQEIERRVSEALAGLGLEKLADRFPHQLSGGQQQRVAIARALVYNPPVILLDEPLSNLDAKLREEAKAWLGSLIRERGFSAIIVTHDQAEALALADRIVLLSDGKIVQVGSPVDMYSNPQTALSAEFFGSNNVLDGVASMAGTQAKFEGAGFSLLGKAKGDLKGGPARGVCRVEEVAITDQPGPNRLKLPLKQSLFAGSHWEHIFTLDGDLPLKVWTKKGLEPGEHFVEIPEESLWLYPAEPTRT